MNVHHTGVLEQAAIGGSYVPSTVSWAQLERGAFEIGYHIVEAAPLRVALRTYNLGFQVGANVQPGKSVVALLAHPRTRARWFGSPFGADAIATSRDTVDVRTDGPSAFFSITVDLAALEARYPQSPDAESLIANAEKVALAMDRVQADRIRGLIARLFSRYDVEPQMASRTLAALLASTLENLNGQALERTKCLNRRFAAVRACERYMRDHVDAPLSLLDLSQIAGMRSRSLINAFEAVTGLSPMEYLKRLRLNGVHRALSEGGRSRLRIIDVATAWGFWHMGHFAADYRTMFGEAPSETLQASQRHFAVG
jgi:AraC family transcriptional regulator, ethanolamine operon transcriptional activator